MKLLNNKKGGEFKAGLWIIILAIYFMFFIFITNGVNTLYETQGLNNISIESSNFDNSLLIGENYCSTPRYGYDANTLEKFEYSNVQNDLLKCDESIGVKSQTICNNINGCNWENVTTGFWFWSSTDKASCIGTINATSYGIQTRNEFFGKVVDSHENTQAFKVITPCNHPNVIQNKSLCALFSCTWSTFELDSTYSSTSSVIDTLGDLFTFRYDFGFSSGTINTLLTFLFFIIPLLLLIMSIYYMLPFAH